MGCLLWLSLLALESYSLLPDVCQQKVLVTHLESPWSSTVYRLHFRLFHFLQSFIFRFPATLAFLSHEWPCSPLAPWLWSNSLLHSTQTCSGVSYCCDADQVPLSSWCAPLLPRVCQKQSHLWCRIPCLLEAILDHSPHNHLSGLWMALIFLCITLWQLITHWLVTFLVQH